VKKEGEIGRWGEGEMGEGYAREISE